jgi:putative flippase GtrA
MDRTQQTLNADDLGTPSGWRLLARHQLGAAVATLVDFGTMIGCVHGGLLPVMGTAIGSTCGAVANFTMGRQWIFPAGSTSRVYPQVLRYGLISVLSLALNALGELVVHDIAHVQYVMARMLVAGVVGLAWNYPLHRAWVFAPRVDRMSHPFRRAGRWSNSTPGMTAHVCDPSSDS